MLVEIENLRTTEDLAELFCKAPLTILNWVRREGLPVVRLPGRRRDSVRYDLHEVLEWARLHGKRVYLRDDVRNTPARAARAQRRAAG